jgi:hypothetical protein
MEKEQLYANLIDFPFQYTEDKIALEELKVYQKIINELSPVYPIPFAENRKHDFRYWAFQFALHNVVYELHRYEEHGGISADFYQDTLSGKILELDDDALRLLCNDFEPFSGFALDDAQEALIKPESELRIPLPFFANISAALLIAAINANCQLLIGRLSMVTNEKWFEIFDISPDDTYQQETAAGIVKSLFS